MGIIAQWSFFPSCPTWLWRCGLGSDYLAFNTFLEAKGTPLFFTIFGNIITHHGDSHRVSIDVRRKPCEGMITRFFWFWMSTTAQWLKNLFKAWTINMLFPLNLSSHLLNSEPSWNNPHILLVSAKDSYCSIELHISQKRPWGLYLGSFSLHNFNELSFWRFFLHRK